MQLTVEQQNFIDSALTGNNVLVDGYSTVMHGVSSK